MSYAEYRDLVKKTRAAQKRYFKKRDNLEECMALERELDRVTAEQDDPTLFPSGAKDEP